MDFWRSGQARTYRDPSAPRKGMGWWQRLTGFHFPAWMPVAFIIVVVFGILAGLFFVQSTKAAPRVGDHFHAPVAFFVCGEQQPKLQEFHTSTGIHTHGDGIIHLHPSNTSGEGGGAAVGNWVDAEGGKMTGSELRVPQRKKETYKAGEDTCEGKPAEVRVLRGDSGIHPLGGGTPGASFGDAIVKCDGLPESAYENVGRRYIPKDGDCIRIIFGPPDITPVVQPDRTIIAPDQATREIQMDVADAGGAVAFSPASIDVRANEIVKIVLRNSGAGFHGLRFSGPDGQYETSDDYVTDPPTLDPGQEGVAVIRFSAAGTSEFRDEAPKPEGEMPATGSVVVIEADAPAPSPTPEPVDAIVDVTMVDNAFEPSNLSLNAGQTFKINLRNTGQFVHNLRIAGPDGTYRTEDDLALEGYVNPNGRAELTGQLDAPGEYAFRCDFHPTEHFGTLTVQ